MQITFNPLDKAEAAAVLRMLASPAIAHADRPDVGAELVTISESAGFTEHKIPAPPASVIPLPPSAPSPAAAEMFGNAPAVPSAGIPLPPGAELPPVPAVPPTPPVAPPAPAAPTNPAPGAELDKDGLPWNAEIHSGERGKNKDGTWRKKRNLDPAVLERVTAQLRALMAIPAPGAQSAVPLSPGATPVIPAGTAPEQAASVPPVPSAPPAAVPATTIPTPPVGDAGNVPPVPPTSAPATAPIPTPPAATAAAPATSNAPVTFAGVMRKVTEGLREQNFNEARVNELLASLGVTKIGHLAARPDLLAAFDALLEAE